MFAIIMTLTLMGVILSELLHVLERYVLRAYKLEKGEIEARREA